MRFAEVLGRDQHAASSSRVLFYLVMHAGRPRAAAGCRDPLDRRMRRRPRRAIWIKRARGARRPGALPRSSSEAVATILGISAFYHDSAACLVRDGEIVAAAQEERFTRKKHDAGLPAPRRRLLPARRAACALDELDYVGFYDKPLLKFERLLESYLGVAPRGLRSFLTAMPVWLQGEALHAPT